MAKRQRSPNYPVVDLEKAIEHTRAVYEQARSFDFPIGLACKCWRLKPEGSRADQIIAALRSYGLIQVTGNLKNRQIRVTDEARRILLKADDAAEVIETCAKNPPINAELLAMATDDGLPPQGSLRHYLLLDRDGPRFGDDVVDSVIDRFMSTVKFAKIAKDDIIEEDETTATEPTQESVMDTATAKASITLPSDAPTSVCILDEGSAYFACPTDISKDSFYDLEAWLDAAMNRLARRAGAQRKKK